MAGLLPDGAEEKEKEASWETWKLDLETGRIGRFPGRGEGSGL